MDNNKSSEIKFDEDKWREAATNLSDKPSLILSRVIKYSGGGIKDEKEAGYFLLGLVGLIILFSIFLFFQSTTKIEGPLAPGGPLGQSINNLR